MLNQDIGKGLIILGVVLLVIGCIVYFGVAKLNWLGNLPGDIKIERENFNLYFPLTTLIILSIAVNLLIRLWRYLI